jgi:glycosyltransferase involved in cell wall biosynthesis
MALRDELARLMSTDQFKLCVWSDAAFVHWSVTDGEDRSAQPMPGDVVITLGLDWDQPYKEKLFELSRKRGLRFITCIYDLIPVLFPQYCVGNVAAYFKDYFYTLAWSSEAVLCISKQTERDFKALCGQFGAPERPTRVIQLGDNVPEDVGEIAKEVRAILEKPYILFVSTIERRKNHEVLYRAYHLLARQGRADGLPRLVFVGMPGWGVGDLLKDIELDPLVAGKTVQLNHVNDAELNALYRGALFCAYPSLYEGWGLPVGEALAMGKAVLASNQGSLPEVGGDLVRYADPWNAYSWAEAIDDWVSHPETLQAAEAAVRLSYSPRQWATTAETVRALALELLEEPAFEVPTLMYPGHDFSTSAAGMHVGAELWSTGEGGFLMFGPHGALPAGRYRIRICDQPMQRTSGEVYVDFAYDSGRRTAWAGRVSVSPGPSATEALVDFEIDLPSPVLDYEIRVQVTPGMGLALTQVFIRRSG